MSTPAPSLPARWKALWHTLGKPAPAGLLNALLAAYREPQRHYHTLQHLEECLIHLDALGPLAHDAAAVELALWFHDGVYDVRAHDNEARSADWAESALSGAGLAAEAVERIRALIMVTCHDAAPGAPDPTPDAALLTDIDLAILAAPPARFAEYARQIRAEYAHVPEALFLDKRRQILGNFLGRERIYQTQPAHDRFEEAARRNLAGAIGADAR